jgi:hypothetical protein
MLARLVFRIGMMGYVRVIVAIANQAICISGKGRSVGSWFGERIRPLTMMLRVAAAR